MFLKSLELFGFKSFADRTRIDFPDGITSLLGPNGCGKSNIVDAIKWVLGEQGVKSLRAEKREDVIFKGTDTRKPMQMAEVILVLDNEEHLLNLDYPEVEIKRRLFRDGTSEFWINRQQVLLKNVKDLFMDTGVGKTAYSILEQGKIDQILSNKPEERRYVFEEAAGISRFKAQCTEARRKIEKTDENIEQVSALFKEVKRTYDSRKSQVEKLLECKRLRRQKEEAEIELQLSTLQAYRKVREMRDGQRQQAASQAQALAAELEQARSLFSGKQQIIDSIREERTAASLKLERLREQKKGLENSLQIYERQYRDARLRLETARDKLGRYETELQGHQGRYDETEAKLQEAQDAISNLEKDLIAIGDEIIANRQAAADARGGITEAQDAITEIRRTQAELTAKLSETANEITRRLQEMIEDSGYSTVLRQKTEKDVVANLVLMSKTLRENGRTILRLFIANPSQNREKLEELYQQIIDYTEETKSLFQTFCGSIPTFIDELVKPDGIIAQKKALDRQMEQSAASEQQQQDRIALLGSELERCTSLNDTLMLREADKKADLAGAKTALEGLQNLFEQLQLQLVTRQGEYSDMSDQVRNEEDSVNESLSSINGAKDGITDTENLITQVLDELTEINGRLDEQGRELSGQNEKVASLVSAVNSKNEEVIKLDSALTSIDELISKTYSDFFDQYGKSLKEFDNHEVTNDVEALKQEVARCKRALADIPYVNEMAEQEFEEVKARYDLYNSNLEDLAKAKADMEKVYAEIRSRSESLFLDCFSKIAESFSTLFCRVFAGGRAQLDLVDPQNPLESGIEILAQPPGEKLTYLPLLSGGQRSMTAVALLFATYAVKPSPFCILDEIDAALDAHNINNFLSVLEDFAGNSQFIIITHNKNTAMGAKTLLGVTQQERGVSKMISYKLDNTPDSSAKSLLK
ncbi:MAG: AAA family ATPase [Spirochaetales bacterium]|nr:AAA family ATPase [Spirochaetales bacterium]